ncbi:MAG: hemerythrin family protein [Bacteroidales bacterium]|nr:hemerythrin family protein [Bacteroidales bacterium]MBN2755701.1 hemerythrin family protein [Bacteroidales bacterium]
MTSQLALEAIKANKQKISDLISFFSKSIDENNGEKEILNIFHKLSFYSSEIFISEELIMKKYEISSLSEHILEHKDFVDKMKYFQQEYENKNEGLCVELLNYLKKWHKTHILKLDEDIINSITSKK